MKIGMLRLLRRYGAERICRLYPAGQATRAGVGPAIAKPLRVNRSSRQQTPVRARQRRVSGDQRLAPLCFFLRAMQSGTLCLHWPNPSPVVPSVIRATQRVAFHLGNNPDSLIEAGAYNLTQDVASCQIYFTAIP
jgi:hypothetical protein